MQININTDRTIDKHQGLDERVEQVVQSAIGRFGEQITRVDVHLSDDNSQKHSDGGNHCLMEARVTGYQPIVANGHAVNLHQAISTAGDKLQRAVDSALGRLHDKQLHATLPVVAPEADADLTSAV
jgi:ribosome-associated translation inhibitor RaiA